MHLTVEGQAGPLAVSWQAHRSQDKLAWPAPFKMECERIGAVLQTRMSGRCTCSGTSMSRGSHTWLAYFASLAIIACCTCRLHNMQAPLEASRLSAAHAVAWRGPPQDNIDWSSSLAPQGLSDEAPGVFTITDRKVRGGDDPFDIPIYTLCRRWVRNDPYNDETSLAEPRAAVKAIQLPEPMPAQAGADSPHPIEGPLPTGEASGEPDAEFLLEHHMTHWLKVREHHIRKIRRKCDRYKHRLQVLMRNTHTGDEHKSNGDKA
ncbi:hypothetical protein ABBQ32_011453 [Trebouxia sp. C0010 RCD-2024]